MTVRLHSLVDVAETLGLSYRHVRRLVASGSIHAVRLPAARLGFPEWHVTEAELDRLIAERAGKRRRS